MKQNPRRITRAQKIDSFKMLVYRRKLKINWKEMKSNVEVVRLIGSIKSIANIIKERKISLYCDQLET